MNRIHSTKIRLPVLSALHQQRMQLRDTSAPTAARGRRSGATA